MFYKKYKIHIVGVVLGLIAGYLYYDQVGCVTGTCAITSNPWMSSLYGSVLGYFVAGIFVDRKKPTFNNNQEKN